MDKEQKTKTGGAGTKGGQAKAKGGGQAKAKGGGQAKAKGGGQAKGKGGGQAKGKGGGQAKGMGGGQAEAKGGGQAKGKGGGQAKGKGGGQAEAKGGGQAKAKGGGQAKGKGGGQAKGKGGGQAKGKGGGQAKGKGGGKAKGTGADDAKVFARNKRASFDYRIVESLECGLALSGWEVKSIRAGKASLVGAYIQFHNQGAYLIGAQIMPLAASDSEASGLDATRTRRILMHKAQMRKMQRGVRSGNFSCVPLSLYQGRSSFLKLSVGLGQGRKRVDKRELIKEREWRRAQARAQKRGR